MIEALKELGTRRVSVVTPYLDSINERMAEFLQGNGFEVVSIAGQQIVPNIEIGAQTPEAILAFAKENLDPSADAYFLSCTNWRAFEVVEQLEQESGKPVVTSNQATIWAAFRALGLREPISSYGSLLRQAAA
jgi:maleate isomerase